MKGILHVPVKAMAGSWAGWTGNPVKGKAWGAAGISPWDRGNDLALCPSRSSSNMLLLLLAEGNRESIQTVVWNLCVSGTLVCLWYV